MFMVNQPHSSKCLGSDGQSVGYLAGQTSYTSTVLSKEGVLLTWKTICHTTTTILIAVSGRAFIAVPWIDVSFRTTNPWDAACGCDDWPSSTHAMCLNKNTTAIKTTIPTATTTTIASFFLPAEHSKQIWPIRREYPFEQDEHTTRNTGSWCDKWRVGRISAREMERLKMEREVVIQWVFGISKRTEPSAKLG